MPEVIHHHDRDAALCPSWCDRQEWDTRLSDHDGTRGHFCLAAEAHTGDGTVTVSLRQALELSAPDRRVFVDVTVWADRGGMQKLDLDAAVARTLGAALTRAADMVELRGLGR